MARNEQENQAARDGMTNEKRLSFRGIYFIGLAATTIGIGVIILLNLATPLEYMRGRLADPEQEWYQKLHHILNLAFLLLLSCPLLLLLIRRFLRPMSEYFHLLRAGQETEDFREKARQGAINLPFILIPLNLGLWILLPSFSYFAAYVTGNLDWRTAIILAIRAFMVGFISGMILPFFMIQVQTRLKNLVDRESL
jgi:MFS family permease